MSSFTFVIALLLAVAVTAQDDIDGEVEGRTFGHLAKPLKKLGHRLGQYLVYATGDYYPHQYQPPIVHHNNHYGSYYNGYQPNGIVGFHAPGFVGGFRDI